MIKTQPFSQGVPQDAISVSRGTILGKGFRSEYRKWLWQSIQQSQPSVIRHLRAIADTLDNQGSVTLLYDEGDEEIAQTIAKCVEWWVNHGT